MSEQVGDAFVKHIDVQAKAQELADKLLGSCEGLPEEVFELEGFAEALDNLAGCCEECGWWVSADELNDSWICGDCETDADDPGDMISFEEGGIKSVTFEGKKYD